MSDYSPLARRDELATSSSADRPASADDHLAITDALLRFGAGTDAGDAALLSSAFADEAVVDFSPCGRKLGLAFEPLRGRGAIVGFLAGTTTHQVTSHIISNARARTAGSRATLRALVDATHFVRADSARRFRMVNWYEAELGPLRGAWQIEHLRIDNIWFEGDPRIILQR